MKFGDKVRLSDAGRSGYIAIGYRFLGTGVIVSRLSDHDQYPFIVKYGDGDFDVCGYSEDELELAK